MGKTPPNTNNNVHFFFSLGKARKEKKKANRQTQSATAKTAEKNKQTNKQAKKKKEKKIPLRGFSLRRYAVTRYAVTRFTNNRICFERFSESGRGRKQLPLSRQRVYQEELFFTLEKVLVMQIVLEQHQTPHFPVI